MSSLILERFQLIKGLDPIADAHNGAPGSDVIDMTPFSRILFVSYRGVATGGTAAPTYTVEACDDTTPSTTSAIAFNMRESYGAVTDEPTTGEQATAGSSAIDAMEVHESALATLGYKYVRLKIAETVNDPVVACILVFGELKTPTGAAYSTVTD